MPVIELETKIEASIEICFNLSRSIDRHKISTAHTNEEAIDGRTSGLINLNEFVTWKAKHFGFTQKLTSRITAYQPPLYFRDEQVKGAFKFFIHEHHFRQSGGLTIMTDEFKFESPFGIFGEIFNKLLLTNHLKRLLINRNKIIKDFAETNKWRAII